MIHKRQPAAARLGRTTLAALLLLVSSVAGAAPSAVDATTVATRVAPAPAVVRPAVPTDLGAPSIQYEEALAHASDPNPFPAPSPDRPLRAVPLTVSTLAPATSGLRREVFGFLPYWEVSDPRTVLNYPTLSTIAYFSVNVDRAGNLVTKNPDGSTSTGWAGWTSAALTKVINAAHQQGVRVVLCLTLFGWSSSEAATQGAMLGSSAARANLVSQAVQAVASRGADGINLDFEPVVSGHTADFTALIRAFRTQLDAVVPGAQLTFDATAEVGNYPVADGTAPGAADAIFVMGYDYRTAGSPVAGSIAPLNSSTYDLGDTLAAYTARTSPSKLILGIPYYGRAWSTVSDAPNAKTQSGTKYGSSSSVIYTSAIDLVAENGRRYDALEASPWTAYTRQNCTSTYGCVTSWRELYYDDEVSLAAKYDLVNRLGLRGAGMWALGYDGARPELNRILAAKFVDDTNPPAAGITALAPMQTSAAFTVAWTAVDDLSGVSTIDVEVATDGGAWTPWQTGVTTTSATFTGASGHSYAFRVRATDGLGHVGAFAAGAAVPETLATGGFARVAVDALAVRAGPDPTAQKLDSLAIGSLVAITGGPVAAGGYTWYQVMEPIREWPAVAPVLSGVWVAAGSGTTAYLTPAPAPNTTTVGAAGPDVTPPVLTARLLGTPFISPNGDGRLDTVEVRGSAPGAAIWTLLISPAVDLTGAPVRTIAGTGEAISASWAGDADAGIAGGGAIPDGPYRLRLIAADAAGNQAAQEWIVTKDTVAPSLAIAVAPTTLSPNGDGYADGSVVTVAPAEPVTGAIEILRGTVSIRKMALAAAGRTSFGWDGRDQTGRGVADGRYVAQVTGQDPAGNVTTKRIALVVDRTAGLLRWSPGRFTPKSGATATASFTLTRTATTTLLVRGPSGKSVRTAWSGRVLRAGRVVWTWDGRDGARHAVAPGNYVAVLAFTTALGTTTITRTVVVQ